MKKQLAVHPFPYDAESNGFIAALSSVVCAAKKYTDETPYWCSPKGCYCKKCGGCTGQSLGKAHLSVYHCLLTASGLAFGFDYPEDDSVAAHTMPNTPVGWRWDDGFMANIMDLAGISFIRCKNKTIAEIRAVIKESIDAGYPAMVANHRVYPNEMAWVSCWKVVCGYTDDGITVMNYGGGMSDETNGLYEDIIVITGEAARINDAGCADKDMRGQTYFDVLRRIYAVLSDPSHDALENEIMTDLSNVTPENAAIFSHKLMGINSVLIEARWHAAEAFTSKDNLLYSLVDSLPANSAASDEWKAAAEKLADLFFTRYIAQGNNETHGIGWEIWACLKVGPQTGYLPGDESFKLIQQPGVQNELKRLFRIVFDNDRAVANGIMEILNTVRN